MESWELDRICIWIRAASISENLNGVKFLIDINEKTLFNLIFNDNEWRCPMNQEISVRYSKEDIKLLNNKIQTLENSKTQILEFPKLSESEIEHIQKVKQELETKRKNKMEFDIWEYDRVIYEKPTRFGIEWIENLGIKLEELSRIGF